MDNQNKKGFLASNFSKEELDSPKLEDHHVEGFKTPDQIAAEDANEHGIVAKHHDTISEQPANQSPEGPKTPLKQRLRNYYQNHKKACLISAALILVIAGATGYLLFKPEKQATIPPIKKVAKVEDKTVPSTLTGLPVDPTTNQRPVTAVMIENSTDARPQSGLGQAGVVFEAIAEGGITRFLTLFQDTAPDNIGPVRSARPYYVEWAMGFDAAYAHVGGSPEAMSKIKAWGVKDMDQFYNSGAYHRINSKVAPHNVYTSSAALSQLEASKGYTTSTYTGFARKAKAQPAKTPEASTIDLDISGPTYNVHYAYNPRTNSYDRTMAGAPHIDANTNTQISPKVVIALVIPYGIQSDGKHSEYGVVGSGQALIFQDGKFITANWSKADQKSQIIFSDAAGAPVKLTPGQTWITAVTSAGEVAHAP